MSLNAAQIQEILRRKPEIVKLKTEFYEERTHKECTEFDCPECAKKFSPISSLAIHIARLHPEIIVDTKEEDASSGKKYPCEKCHKVFDRAVTRRSHRFRVHGKGNFVRECKDCDKTFADDSGYRRHMAIHQEGGMVKCELCEKVINKHHLTAHTRTHTADLFTCHLCGQCMTSKRSIERHILTVHLKSTKLECDICHKIYADKCTLKKHLAIHSADGKILCQICAKPISKYEMGAHLKVHDKKYKCHLCEKTFPVNRKLVAHVQSVHEKVFQYECTTCKKEFANQLTYMRHMVGHTEGGTTACPICAKICNKAYMHDHMRNHDENHKCDFCEKAFSKNSKLELHTISMHENDLYSDLTEHRCEDCDKCFVTYRWLQVHIKQIHIGDRKCTICDKILPHARGYQRHMAKHASQSKAKCNVCTSDELCEHKKPAGRRYCCEICGKDYSSPASLYIHNKQIHDPNEKTTCKICGKTLSTKKVFKKHLETHSDAGKVTCSVCGKLISKYILTQHMKIHGEKNYKCEACGKGFAQAAGLAQHMVTHKNNREADKRPCELCGRILSSKASLYFHKRGVHGMGGPQCTVCGKSFASNKGLKEHMKSHNR